MSVQHRARIAPTDAATDVSTDAATNLEADAATDPPADAAANPPAEVTTDPPADAVAKVAVTPPQSQSGPAWAPSATQASPPSAPPARGVPRTRTGAAWVGICAVALSSVALVIFMLQNTRSVEVTFLWMHGTLPLALALLVAAIGVAILAIIVGTARITQLRHLIVARGKPRGPDGKPTS